MASVIILIIVLIGTIASGYLVVQSIGNVQQANQEVEKSNQDLEAAVADCLSTYDYATCEAECYTDKCYEILNRLT